MVVMPFSNPKYIHVLMTNFLLFMSKLCFSTAFYMLSFFLKFLGIFIP